MLRSKSQGVTFSETLEQKRNENVTEIPCMDRFCVCVCLSVCKDVGGKSQAVTFSETLEQKRDENVTADQT